MQKDDILAATTWRRAIKKFSSRKISDDNWQFLLSVARLAPSSYGFEPWNILDVRSSELREKLKPALGLSNSAKLAASHFVVFTVKNDLGADSKYFREIMTNVCHDNKIVQTAVLLSFKSFQNKQQDLTDVRKRHDWAAKQAYIAFAQMIFAAAEIGIDSCPIEGFDNDLATKILAGAGVLDIDKDSLTLMAAFGYRDGEPAFAKTRREISEIVREV